MCSTTTTTKTTAPGMSKTQPVVRRRPSAADMTGAKHIFESKWNRALPQIKENVGSMRTLGSPSHVYYYPAKVAFLEGLKSMLAFELVCFKAFTEDVEALYSNLPYAYQRKLYIRAALTSSISVRENDLSTWEHYVDSVQKRIEYGVEDKMDDWDELIRTMEKELIAIDLRGRNLTRIMSDVILINEAAERETP